MPIYEYECDKCGNVFEMIQAYSAPHPINCEACGKGPVTRLISRSGFVLKGAGFYTTEHPSASRKAAQTQQKKEKTPTPAKVG